MLNTEPVTLDGSSLSQNLAIRISLGAPVKLASRARDCVEACRAVVDEIVAGETVVYGVNTGFGYFANTCIAQEELKKLQENIILSHAAGYGEPLSEAETRLAMALRLNVLLQGYTGVRWKLCCALQNLINHGIYPLIPRYGSVGASGDLAPLAHLALPLIGRGQVRYHGKEMPAKKALALASLKPIELVEKEGLGLINGTQVMLAIGLLAFTEARKLAALADLVAALSYEAQGAHTSPLDPRIHRVRRQNGQELSAQKIREHLEGSYLWDEGRSHRRVQDPYSLRCAPQVHGATHDALAYVSTILDRELQAVTDNPLLFADHGEAISGGNFHGQPLAMAFDFAAIAVAELGNVSERRLELLLNPHDSGLHAFLAPTEGLESGYMAVQYLSASLVNQNKLLAHPACTDSIPGNVGIEDHVSMGMTSARKLRELVDNSFTILAVEALCACQATELRKVKNLGMGTQKLYDAIRAKVPHLDQDRMVSDDVEGAVSAIKDLVVDSVLP